MILLSAPRSLLRPAPLFVLFSYALLTLVPLLPLVLGGSATELPQTMAVAGLLWLAVWAILQRPAWFHWLLLPAFLALPTEVYLFKYYGQGISTHHLGIIAETSPKEAMEFLGNKVWLMGGLMLAVLGWWLAVQLAAQRCQQLAWRGLSRWIALALLALLAGWQWYGWEFGVKGKPVPRSAPPAGAYRPLAASASAAASGSASASASVSADSASDAEDEEDEDEDEEAAGSAVAGAHHTRLHLAALPWWLGSPFNLSHLAASWPFGLSVRGVDFYKERSYLADLGQRSRNFRFGARQRQSDNTPEVVIMVIGESSRYDRWGINGYQRDTTPLLGKEPNLVTLADVITSVSATRLSVPIMISRKPATQSLREGFSEKSFITAYREAGFKTWWLSNQIAFGKFDTPVSVFAKEADVVQFMNLGGYTKHSNYDQVLLEPLQHAMADPSPKKLIVLHTLGNHWNYSQRYPQQYDRWQPSLYGVDNPVYTDLKIKTRLNNSYDNSILYTDWFLSQVIGQLKGGPRRSAMLYVADHGQTLYDDRCNLAFHGHNTQYEFHVPAMLWYSDQYRSDYPDKVAQLIAHRKNKLATENVFHTLLDLADIAYPDEKLEWSFLSPQLKAHKRYVDSYGWSNYDNASFRGDCREVIDKGRPLKQEK
ncbi:sulfatase-like hydrolase/transferase [Pseudoduganella sp. FT93W]|uniref:Sulfatase-like hydrolase/transferase n=1 Tax=Duganella fentianensis TaxID=2692177 RepID=A0A845I4X2_9BURK|nr:phosphoethanolamine transferase [Duganella fentianensis]MYN46526.1 sulfatase-like hydrolase/transferase [Duganella fentianensis]